MCSVVTTTRGLEPLKRYSTLCLWAYVISWHDGSGLAIFWEMHWWSSKKSSFWKLNKLWGVRREKEASVFYFVAYCVLVIGKIIFFTVLSWYCPWFRDDETEVPRGDNLSSELSTSRKCTAVVHMLMCLAAKLWRFSLLLESKPTEENGCLEPISFGIK